MACDTHEADHTLAGILGRNIDANDSTWDAAPVAAVAFYYP